MKKILFCLFFILSVVCANAQSDYDYLKYQFREQNKKNRIERQERIENGNYSFATGLNVGYSSENFLKIAWKIGGNKTMFVIDGGIMTSPPKIIKNNENWEYYNNHTLNFGLAYTILPKFYIGVLGGFNRIIYDEIDGYEIKNVLNKTNFNCGIVLGCIIKGVDLSVSYSKVEQFSFQIGFLFRD
jgi:hypothetical protein